MISGSAERGKLADAFVSWVNGFVKDFAMLDTGGEIIIIMRYHDQCLARLTAEVFNDASSQVSVVGI